MLFFFGFIIALLVLCNLIRLLFAGGEKSLMIGFCSSTVRCKNYGFEF
jgi:hypothetical protein